MHDKRAKRGGQLLSSLFLRVLSWGREIFPICNIEDFKKYYIKVILTSIAFIPLLVGDWLEFFVLNSEKSR